MFKPPSFFSREHSFTQPFVIVASKLGCKINILKISKAMIWLNKGSFVSRPLFFVVVVLQNNKKTRGRVTRLLIRIFSYLPKRGLLFLEDIQLVLDFSNIYYPHYWFTVWGESKYPEWLRLSFSYWVGKT